MALSSPGAQSVSVGSHPLQRPPPPYTGLSGPSYSISGLPEKFRLPPARVLQVSTDRIPHTLVSELDPLHREGSGSKTSTTQRDLEQSFTKTMMLIDGIFVRGLLHLAGCSTK